MLPPVAFAPVPAAFPLPGALIFLVVLGGGCWWLLRRAARAGVLGPVAVGLVLRAVVMLAAHLGSVGEGHGGYMFLDDLTLSDQARLIADEWSRGNFVDPAAGAYAGSYQFGFQVMETLVFLLVGTTSVLAVKAVNVVLGAAAVLAGARLGSLLF